MGTKKKKKNDNSSRNGSMKSMNCDQICIGTKMKKQKQLKRKQFLCERDYRLRSQEVLYSSEFIFAKIFRKDGPLLGHNFDPLPDNAFSLIKCTAPQNDLGACQEDQRVYKRRKLCAPTLGKHTCGPDGPPQMHGIGKGLMTVKAAISKAHGMGKGLFADKNGSARNHGVGKGLMTVWHATNPNAGDMPADFGHTCDRRPPKKKKKQQRRQLVAKKIVNKSKEKKLSVSRRKSVSQQVEKWKQPWKEKCKLTLEGLESQVDCGQFTMLEDDEDLELQELQAGSTPLRCSAHLDGLHGCSLCKDLLAKFPPDSVTMRLPLHKQPWGTSPELLKKLFKVFHFLCTYAVKINITSFTLDEFAQSFHKKDSLLIGQVHVCLLKFLLLDLDTELACGIFPYACKNSKFFELLHSIESQEFVLESWKKSLNSLTWAEILRQVLVAAGYGSKISTELKNTGIKAVSPIEKHGLRSGTLKGELFSLLLAQGSGGMKISELALSAPIADLNLAPSRDELETLISSMLAKDVTLFEKISSTGYRLRVNFSTVESGICLSESDNVDSNANSEVIGQHSSFEDSECEPVESDVGSGRHKDSNVSPNNTITGYTEIDESKMGEPWLLGLAEGEYSDLSVAEKLNSLAALVDLVNARLSIRREEPMISIKGSSTNIYQFSSGGKIKRAVIQQYGKDKFNTKDFASELMDHPIDSLICFSSNCGAESSFNKSGLSKEMEAGYNSHPMQSVFLGYDRRYNRYWFFLGPCDKSDPGHRRIYFESSEDGHWEMIDSQEALFMLMSSLDSRGAREAFLLASLKSRESFLIHAMSNAPDESWSGHSSQSCLSDLNISREESSSAVSEVDNLEVMIMQSNCPVPVGSINADLIKKSDLEEDVWDGSQAFDAWVWKSFYSDLNAVKHGKIAYLHSLTRCGSCHDLYWREEKHCKICHTSFELDFDLEEKYAIHTATCRVNTGTNKFPRHKVLPSQLQALKAAVYAVESMMPDDLLCGSWRKSAHKLWMKRLLHAATFRELLQVLADFVNAISEDWLCQFRNAPEYSHVQKEIFTNFSGMPQTSSAIALWLVKLDMVVSSYLE